LATCEVCNIKTLTYPKAVIKQPQDPLEVKTPDSCAQVYLRQKFHYDTQNISNIGDVCTPPRAAHRQTVAKQSIFEHLLNAIANELHKTGFVTGAYPASVYGITEVPNVDDPHQHTDHRNSFGQEAAKLIQFLLQGCHLISCLSHGVPAKPM